MKDISFSSVENFYEESRIGIEFECYGEWYQIDFDDPQFGESRMQIAKCGEENLYIMILFSTLCTITRLASGLWRKSSAMRTEFPVPCCL